MAVSGFGIENLPYGVFRRGGPPSIGVAIEESIFDLRRAAEGGLLAALPPETREACAMPRLNELMSLGRRRWRELRAQLTELLAARAPAEPFLLPRADTTMLLPADIGDYTDFYASIHHATNVGRLFRPDHPLLPNYRWMPIAYHGRASSIVPSGTAVRRPRGQAKDADAAAPRFGPSQALDYELEVGFLIGDGNPPGEPVPVDAAEDRIFGVCLVNDWSARDIQAWEYQPLGPFLGKSFATSISPWVVTLDALEPYRVAPAPLDPAPLPYLASPAGRAIDLTLEVELTSARMRATGIAPFRLSRGNLRDLYWTPAQMVAHHTSNGCNLRPGDLLASGTVSGAAADARGCLLEITRRGAEPLTLPTGETRRFLEDGDEVILRGWCEREGLPRIALGECAGRIARA
ncbi:MAG: fumarylacetoacetase [Acidobacteria bacterium]|nr:fumarylacetoacetase [Acidobacteriota bacterium]